MRRTTTFAAALVLTACGGDGTAPIDVTSISVSTSATSVGVASQVQLSATARDATGNALSGVRFTWSSSARSTATVDANGLVSGVSPGTATISASAGGATGSVTMTVTASNGVVVSMPGNSFVPFQSTIRVGGTVLFEFPSVVHNVIFDDPKPPGVTDIQNTSNRSVPRTFNSAGTFPYDCRLHPGMSGVVVMSP